MAGFIIITMKMAGEGCFFIKVNKSRNKAGVGVQLVFQVSQHIRDQELLKSFVSYFNCALAFDHSNDNGQSRAKGQYINSNKKEWGYFQCTKFSDIYNIIIPFCSQHSTTAVATVRGIKAKDFLDCVTAAVIINKGDHLSREGSSKIISIKTGMNTGRYWKIKCPWTKSKSKNNSCYGWKNYKIAAL